LNSKGKKRERENGVEERKDKNNKYKIKVEKTENEN
jgi:hypothetical protein